MMLKPSFAQTASFDEPDYLSKHSYTEQMNTYFVVEDISSVTALDKLKLIPKSQTKRYDKYFNEDNKIITIVEFINSEKRSTPRDTQHNSLEPISFQIFPVPVGDLLTVSVKSNVQARSWFTISIFDTNGRSVFREQEQNPFPYNISINQLPRGTYIIKIEGKDASWTERFIKL